MSTERVRERLRKYVALLKEIDNQLERIGNIEIAMAAPPGPDLSGMPKAKGGISDRTSMMVERKMELEKQIDRLKAEEKAERKAIESMAELMGDPDERLVIQLKYLDRASWSGITAALYGSRPDFADKADTYQRRMYRIHGRALLSLAEIEADVSE